MQQPVRTLSLENIEAIKREFHESLECIGDSIQGKTGLPLLISLKRDRLGVGPYPNVTLFEAANRIMSDLVIIHGISGLLAAGTFPFTKYTVEFGNEDKNGFDLRAESPTATLVGEAFNVAPSFFQGKKSSALRKLREKAESATYRVVMFNAEAAPLGYSARTEPSTYYVAVNVAADKISVTPNVPNKIEKICEMRA